MKAYVSFVLVILILTSLITMDVLISSIGREKSPILAQERMFYANVESSRRIEEATAVGSAIGINLYIRYKEEELKAALLPTGGTVVAKDVAETVDLDEMEAWSDAGVLMGLSGLNQDLGLNSHGFWCTWANDQEIRESLDSTVEKGVLTVPRARTVSLNIENCFELPHSQINFIGNLEDLPVNGIKAGNISALDASVTLYDEESPENGYRKGRLASLYHDEGSNIASFATFPETRRIQVPYVGEAVMARAAADHFSGFFGVLYSQYGRSTNETIAEKIIESLAK